MKTVKVRIAVAVDKSGKWNASGWGEGMTHADEEAMDIAVGDIDEGEARYWVEAELPIPEVETVSASKVTEEQYGVEDSSA